jgi:hypothetical protein
MGSAAMTHTQRLVKKLKTEPPGDAIHPKALKSPALSVR